MLHTEFARAGWTDAPDEATAVRELHDQIGDMGRHTGFLFCSPDYDRDRIAPLLAEAFGDRMVGCTTAGEITPAGYRRGTLTGFVLDESVVSISHHLVTGISSHEPDGLREVERAVRGENGGVGEARPGENRFGIVLSDGLARSEDRLLGELRAIDRNLSLTGGSAGDCLEFRRTGVYYRGCFHADAAVFCLARTERPVHFFRTHHFEPGRQQMIVTRADTANRIALQINGHPAVEEYSRWIGNGGGELTPSVFARHPLMAGVGRDQYVRSVQRATPDGGLQFFCPVQEGLVLTGARPLDLLQQTQGALAEVHASLDPEIVLGFECVLRRLEMMEDGLLETMGELMVESRVIGCNTYGQQSGGLHLNHSLTGVAIGR